MKTSKKIPKTFISFLVTSFFIWLLITFSKEYTAIISFPVNYNNIDQNKLLREEPIKDIDFSVKASGFKILRAKLSNKKINLESSNLNRKGSTKFYLLPKNQFSKIQRQLFSGVELQEVMQDTIYLNLGVLASKKLKLLPDLEIGYHIGYDLIGEINVSPDSIVVSGPKSTLDTIQNIRLKKLVLNDVKSDFNFDVPILESNTEKNLKINITEATITGKVDKFTEGNIKVPFAINNLPKNMNLTILQEEVEVIFVVALSNFAKVSAASFKVECDFEMSQKNNLGYLIPKVVSQPNFVKSIRVIPSEIDFLIQK